MPAVKTAVISQMLATRLLGAGGEETAMNLPFDWTIRSAAPGDANAIAGILRDCWPHDTPDVQRITRLIRTGTHDTYCAWAGGVCAAFVDAFRTTSADGTVRLEVDLLAVHHSARGRGIGKALIEAATEVAPPDVSMARGLIRIGNTTSERAFAAAGFQVVDMPLTLCVASPLASDASLETGYVVSVETFTYCGLWLESPPSLGVLNATRAKASQLGVGQVGTLVAEGNERLCEAAGYERIGVYQWWVRAL